MNAPSLFVTLRNYFLAGLAFGIAFLLFVIGSNEVERRDAKANEELERAELAKVVVKDHRLTRAETGASVIGQVSNSGTKTWRWVRIMAEFQNANNQVVEICGEGMDGVIRPGESRSFQIRCVRPPREPMPEFDKYSVFVSSAYEQ